MSKRKGFMAVSLLLLLSALTAVLGGLLFALSRGRGGSLVYGNGLSAIYTAESGANWALASLKQGPVENKEITISLDGREARVRISSVTKEGNTWKGKISSDGVDLQTKVMRFVKITFTVEDEGERKIMVESVGPYFFRDERGKYMERKDFFRRCGFTNESDALCENYFYCRR